MHKPVLLSEVTRLISEIQPKTILDGTFGRGGHARALIESCPGARMVAMDRDPDAVAHARGLNWGKDFSCAHFNFHHIARFPDRPPGGFDAILIDLGVSSPQLDRPERGFSFYHDGPLDMRMDPSQGLTAADIVNTWSEVELIELFRDLGEIQRPARVARAIVNDRKSRPFTGTRELADLIARIEGWRQKGHHPATRYFLALRMAVNDEMSGLKACLPELISALSERGRLVVITFHSQEDRVVKYAFKEATALGHPLFKKVIVPSREEIAENPRARSAKLRVFQRGAAK